MSPVFIVSEAELAAERLGGHPQDHGWRELYRLFAHGLKAAAPELTRTIVDFRESRPTCSYSHVIVLLGIAVKETRPEAFERLTARSPANGRLDLLEMLLQHNRSRIERILSMRQNSFTAARRFLIPQIVLGAYFDGTDSVEVNFADLGTGLGLLPRQLNSRTVFEAFGGGLSWLGRTPAFRTIPLRRRLGVDRGPLPDLRWVHACYGASEYYARLYDELVFTLNVPEVRSSAVHYEELDLLDAEALGSFLRRHRVNAVNLSYVLYELEAGIRNEVVDTVRRALDPPRLVIVTEPRDELTAQGCTVTHYDDATGSPQAVCAVSDGHFRGEVSPLADYEYLIRRHPIQFVR
jgi:hypothetical protein